jgi:aryl-alcohol dehydrogenase-like predicted oxidoreductase
MGFRRLGRTGLEVSVIGLGTWQFSGEWGKSFSQPEVDELIGRAGELGVNLIDTAECYGDQQSRGGSDADFETPGLWEALQKQVRGGQIRHLGISLDPHDGARARRAPDVGAGAIQVPYSRLQSDAKKAVLPACAELGLCVRAREPLANGYLTGKYRPSSRITSPNASNSSSPTPPPPTSARLRRASARDSALRGERHPKEER